MASPYDQDSDDRIYTPTRSFRFSGLLRKELREILRDRRTVITLILMPLLVYPLLGLMLQKFFLSQASQLNEIEYRIVLPNESEGQMFRALFEEGEKILSERNHSIKKLKPVQENQADNALAAFQDVQPVVKFMIADPTGDNHNLLKLVLRCRRFGCSLFSRRSQN